MNFKTISAKAILNKVHSDFGVVDTNWYAYAVEWIGEALQAIRHHGGFEKCHDTLEVVDHLAFMPECSYQLLGVIYNQCRLAVGGRLWDYTPGVFDTAYSDPFVPYGITDPRNPEAIVVSAFERYSTAAYGSVDDWYKEEDNVIKTSFETGDIEILYTKFRVDNEGYPMVPDSFEHREAMAWYIYSKLLLSGRVESQQFDWEKANFYFRGYCRKAANASAFPTVDEMEMFSRMFVRMVPATAGFSNRNTDIN